MVFRVELTDRAARDLRLIYQTVHAEDAAQARGWFNGLELLILSLDELPDRGAIIAEDKNLRQLLYGRRRHIWRIIYRINKASLVVSVLHIRHGARDAFAPEGA